MKKRIKRLISLTLVLLLIIGIIPMETFAKEKSNIDSLSIQANKYESADIEYEIEDERTQYSKTFLLEDGTYATYISAIPIHTETKEGMLEDINEIKKTTKITDLQKTLSSDSKSIQTRSGESSSSDSIIAGDSDLTYTTIGNGISGIGSDELRIQQYDDENTLTQIYSVGYIKWEDFDLPDLGGETIVTHATFSAWCQNLNGNNRDDIVTAQIVNDEWPSGNNYEHPIDSGVLDYNVISSSNEEYYEWDITEAACGWSNNTLENNGIALTPYDNDCKVTAYADSMILYYKAVNELDDSFSYHTIDMGRAGMVYINDFTRDLFLVRDELSIDGNILPVSITRTFDSSEKTIVSSTGTGWHWNYVSSLNRVRISNEYYYKWIRDNGSIVIFEADNGSWVEQGNDNGYVLTVGSTQNTITSDNDEYIYKYGLNSHKLESIVDEDNNEMSFDYDNNYGLSKVTDGVGRQFVLNGTTINGNSYVNKMALKDSSNSNITLDGTNVDLDYTYNNGAIVSLSEVEYPDNEIVEYSYDSDHNLNEITNIDGTSLEITYDDYGKVVSYVKYASNGTTVLDSITINSSESYQRIFSDNNGNITRQQYDTELNVISEITGKDGRFTEYDENNEVASISVTEEHDNLLTNPDFSDGLTGWQKPNNRGVEVITDSNPGFKENLLDDHVLKIPGYINSINYAKQLYELPNGEDYSEKIFTVGAWAKVSGSVAKEDESNHHRTIGVIVSAYFAQNNNVQNIATLTFDSSISDWQYNMVSFVIPNNTDGIQVAFTYNYQIGEALYDGIALYQSSDSYVSGIDPVRIGCDCCENCTEPNCPCTCPDENSCECIYCQRGSFANPSTGLPSSETITDGVSSMKKEYSYTNDSNYLLTSKDENGVISYYTYDVNTGKLNDIAIGNSNNKCNYAYNSVGLLKTVSQTITNTITNTNVNMISSYTYDGDTISSITHNGMVYSFDYDEYGNITNVALNNTDIVTSTYTNDGNNIGSIVYANGKAILYEYTTDGNIRRIYSATVASNGNFDNQVLKYEYTYSNGNLTEVSDLVNNTVTRYADDEWSVYSVSQENGNPVETLLYKITDNELLNEYEFDFNSVNYKFTQSSPTESYSHSNAVTTSTASTFITKTFSDETTSTEEFTSTSNVDYYGRTLSNSYGIQNNEIATSYTYKTNGNYTTNLVATSTTTIGNEQYVYEYDYDNAGRVTSKSLNNNLVAEYEYDEAGQLINDANYQTNYSYLYSYDAGGNVDSVICDVVNGESNPTSSTYVYQGDRLTSFDGTTINYDDNGNMLNDEVDYYSYSWNEQNQLSQVSRESTRYNDYYKYYYNDEGLLTSKINSRLTISTNNETQKNSWEYYWNGNKLIGQKYIQKGFKSISYKNELGRTITTKINAGTYYSTVLYNDRGEIIGFNVNGLKNNGSVEVVGTYYYIKDITGQINKIVSATDSSEYANILYDAWGMIEDWEGSDPVALYCSPFLYKDYIYDFDADLYYCQSRFYSPYLMRFLSMDSIYDTGSRTPNANNVYIYCENDPINNSDPTGFSKLSNMVNKSSNVTMFVTGVASAIITLGVFVAKNVTVWGIVSKIVTAAALIATSAAFLVSLNKLKSCYKTSSNKYKSLRNYNVALYIINVVIIIVGEILGSRVLKNNLQLAASLILATIGVRTITVVGVTFNLVNLLANTSILSYKTK